MYINKLQLAWPIISLSTFVKNDIRATTNQVCMGLIRILYERVPNLENVRSAALIFSICRLASPASLSTLSTSGGGIQLYIWWNYTGRPLVVEHLREAMGVLGNINLFMLKLLFLTRTNVAPLRLSIELIAGACSRFLECLTLRLFRELAVIVSVSFLRTDQFQRLSG